MKARNHTFLSNSTTSQECKARDWFRRSKVLFHFTLLDLFLYIIAPPPRSLPKLQKHVNVKNSPGFFAIGLGVASEIIRAAKSHNIYDLLQEMCMLGEYICFHFCTDYIALLVPGLTFRDPFTHTVAFNKIIFC